jgi:hypothetical protein
MLNVLAMDAPALQIVFAARPALLERLSHPGLVYQRGDYFVGLPRVKRC